MRHFSNLAGAMRIEQATIHPKGLGEPQQAEFSIDRVGTDREKPTNFW
jgi:hypothetical protein